MIQISSMAGAETSKQGEDLMHLSENYTTEITRVRDRLTEPLGTGQIQEAFGPEADVEYDPDKLKKVLHFLTEALEMKRVDELRRMLEEIRNNPDQAESLSEVLTGRADAQLEHWKDLMKSDVYTVALYLYVNTDHSKEAMSRVLSHLVANFDDPEASHYDVDADGLGAAPFLGQICRQAMDANECREEVREKVSMKLEMLSKQNPFQYDIGRANALRMKLKIK